MHKTLENWTARRSGPHMTILGTDMATGEAIKVSSVTSIYIREHPADIVALDSAGTEHVLLRP